MITAKDIAELRKSRAPGITAEDIASLRRKKAAAAAIAPTDDQIAMLQARDAQTRKNINEDLSKMKPLEKVGAIVKHIPSYFTNESAQEETRAGVNFGTKQIMDKVDASKNALRAVVDEGKRLDTFDPIGNAPRLAEAFKEGFTREREVPIREVMPPVYKKWADEHPQIGAWTDMAADAITSPSMATGVLSLSTVAEKVGSKALERAAARGATNLMERGAAKAANKIVDSAPKAADEIIEATPRNIDDQLAELQGRLTTIKSSQNLAPAEKQAAIWDTIYQMNDLKAQRDAAQGWDNRIAVDPQGQAIKADNTPQPPAVIRKPLDTSPEAIRINKVLNTRQVGAPPAQDIRALLAPEPAPVIPMPVKTNFYGTADGLVSDDPAALGQRLRMVNRMVDYPVETQINKVSTFRDKTPRATSNGVIGTAQPQFSPTIPEQKASFEGFQKRLASRNGTLNEVRQNDQGELYLVYNVYNKDRAALMAKDGRIVNHDPRYKNNFQPVESFTPPTMPTAKGMLLKDRAINTSTIGTNRKINAYQFDNPEVKPFYKEYAEYILETEFVPNAQRGRLTAVMDRLKDQTGMVPKDIKEALERLVNDAGQENVAAAKRVELVIDDMLTNGFDSVLGEHIGPIKPYLDIKARLEGRNIVPESQPTLDNIRAYDRQSYTQRGIARKSQLVENPELQAADQLMGIPSKKSPFLALPEGQTAQQITPPRNMDRPTAAAPGELPSVPETAIRQSARLPNYNSAAGRIDNTWDGAPPRGIRSTVPPQVPDGYTIEKAGSPAAPANARRMPPKAAPQPTPQATAPATGQVTLQELAQAMAEASKTAKGSAKVPTEAAARAAAKAAGPSPQAAAQAAAPAAAPATTTPPIAPTAKAAAPTAAAPATTTRATKTAVPATAQAAPTGKATTPATAAPATTPAAPATATPATPAAPKKPAKSGGLVQSDPVIVAIAPDINEKGFIGMKDVFRNFRDIFGDHYDYVKEKYLDPLDEGKKGFAKDILGYTDKIYDDVVKGMGFNKESRESAAIQWYGEHVKNEGHKLTPYNYKDLLKDFGKEKAHKIVKANKLFRKLYDETLDRMNAEIMAIHNDPSKMIPKRADYYHHYQEITQGFKALINMFDTPGQAIASFAKPNTKFNKLAQKRGQGLYDADAIGGFLDYIPAAAYAINIDRHIVNFRQLARDIAEGTANLDKGGRVVNYINEFADSLIGKTNKIDATFERLPGGERNTNVLTWFNNRAKSNQVLGNNQSLMSQFANVPVGMSRVKDPVAMAKGLTQTFGAIVGKGNPAIKDSGFMLERYLHRAINRFDKKLIHQPKKLASWLLESADRIGTTFIWNSAYNKGLAKGMKDPTAYANGLTRSVVGGRGIGEVPLTQQSKYFQMVAPFQLEVGNLWHVMKDQVKEKDFGGLALLLLGNYIFNNITEGISGNRVTLDPIKALEDALFEEDGSNIAGKAFNALTGKPPRFRKNMNPGMVAGRVAGEALSNLPMGQTLVDFLYPEYGSKFELGNFSLELPTRKELFGKEDPTRFGRGILASKSLSDPLYKLLPSFGGNQVKKTIEGIQSVNQGMVKDKNGNMLFPEKKSTGNYIRSAAFGKFATPEAQEYFGKDRRPLSADETEKVSGQENVKQSYEALMQKRDIDTQINKIKADKNLTADQKYERIEALKKPVDDLMNQYKMPIDMAIRKVEQKVSLTPAQRQAQLKALREQKAKGIKFVDSVD